jgi:hypothetical protein
MKVTVVAVSLGVACLVGCGGTPMGQWAGAVELAESAPTQVYSWESVPWVVTVVEHAITERHTEAEIALHTRGPENIQRKNITTIHYEPITIEVGMGMSKGFYELIAHNQVDCRETTTCPVLLLKMNAALTPTNYDLALGPGESGRLEEVSSLQLTWVLSTP